MSKNTKKLVPKLRFPEFRDVGEWEEKELSNFSECGLSNGVFNDPKKVGRGYRLVNVLDMYIDTVIDETKLSLVELSENEFLKNRVENGDIFFTRSSLVKSGIAYSNIYTGNSSDITFDGHLIRFRPNKRIIFPMFANYLLRTSKVRSQLVARGKSATMTTIGQADVAGVKLTVPTTTNEQQKIADCLSSIDDLISAQSQKVEALKTHKKGLMQQLFPREGETVPRLRFPEFRDAGEWVEKTLGQIAKYENGKAHEQDIADSGKFIVVNSKFISTEGEVRKHTNSAFCIAEKNDILMVLSDVPNGRAIAKCFLVDADNRYTVNQRICRLTPHKAVSLLLFYALNRNSHFLAFDDGVKQTNLKKDDVLDCPVLLPKDLEEQQKIADCLSSMDNLISAQAQKLESLKVHKRGLMQQLFPVMDEAEE